MTAADTDLAALYEGIFDTPPSANSRKTLSRMQLYLKLKPGDAYSRMLIVSLRTADQMEETRRRLEDTAAELQSAIATAKGFKFELSRSMSRITRDINGIPYADRPRIKVDVYRKDLPVVSYLRHAFMRRGPRETDQHNESVGAARFDAFLLSCLLLMAAMLGALGALLVH